MRSIILFIVQISIKDKCNWKVGEQQPIYFNQSTKKSSDDVAGNASHYWVFELFGENERFKHIKTGVAIKRQRL